ncbi:multiple epidermal growth factor-like domains protein 11 [Saccostrea cucullata]|uniref:multiple epidermal growth factor-like domains protein 11 n=1 Tax=Saccostrea cuccullata TaxID=36930 RepID=UPI002ED00C18
MYTTTSYRFIGNTDQIQFSTTAAHTVTSTSTFGSFTDEPYIEFAITATISPACKVGSYGENCALVCNDTCIGCDRANGICDSGFHPGWKGKFCDEECDLGLHGEDCSMQCGHCLESLPCHAINGSCLHGCAAGYEGFLCNKKEEKLR